MIMIKVKNQVTVFCWFSTKRGVAKTFEWYEKQATTRYLSGTGGKSILSSVRCKNSPPIPQLVATRTYQIDVNAGSYLNIPPIYTKNIYQNKPLTYHRILSTGCHESRSDWRKCRFSSEYPTTAWRLARTQCLTSASNQFYYATLHGFR